MVRDRSGFSQVARKRILSARKMQVRILLFPPEFIENIGPVLVLIAQQSVVADGRADTTRETVSKE